MTTTFPDSYYKKVINSLLTQKDVIDAKGPEVVLTHTLELLSHFLNLNNGRVFLWDTQSANLVIRYSHGLSEQQINMGKYEVSEGITGKAFGTGHPVLVKNIYTEPCFMGKVTSLSAEDKRLKSYIAIPIRHEEQDFGVLAIDCNNSNDGDIEAYALVLKLVSEMFGEIIHKHELNEFDLYSAA